MAVQMNAGVSRMVDSQLVFNRAGKDCCYVPWPLAILASLVPDVQSCSSRATLDRFR